MGSVVGYDEKLVENERLAEELKKKAQKLRWDVIISMGVGVAGYTERSNSSADIVAALYFCKIKHDPRNPKWKERDRFLLSKGYAEALQYTAPAESGHFPMEDLKHTKEIGSYPQGHPDVQKIPGIEAGTGSLGQGFSVNLNMALKQRPDHLDSRTYVLVEDSEIAEGQVWEATMVASAFKADNLAAVVDRNRLQTNGRTKERFDTKDIVTRFLSLGWHVIEINGHDMGEILGALDRAETVEGVPTAIIADTVKGKGISFAENVMDYHNEILTGEAYRQALQELTEQE